MSDYDNSNRLVLWLEDDVPSDRHPFAKGKLELGEDLVEAIVNGQREISVSAWKNIAKSGKKMITGQLQIPRPAQGFEARSEKPVDNDEIPF